MAKTTICVKCEHLIHIPADHPRCKANPEIDYVTGAERLRPCFIKNEGDCKDYKPTPTGHDEQADAAWAKDGDE